MIKLKSIKPRMGYISYEHERKLRVLMRLSESQGWSGDELVERYNSTVDEINNETDKIHSMAFKISVVFCVVSIIVLAMIVGR